MTELHAQKGVRVWLEDLDAELAKGADPAGLIVCAAQGGETGEVNASSREIFHWISNKAPDRSKDVVAQEGIKFDTYATNPVWMWCHGYYSLPIGTSVDHGVKGGRAYSVVKYWHGDGDHGAFCDTVFKMNVERILRGCSIGGRMLSWERNDKRGGLDINELDLYEVSKCAIPDQPLALSKAAAAAGIDLRPVLKWGYQLLEEATKDGVVDEAAPLVISRGYADALAKYLGYGKGLDLVIVGEALSKRVRAEPAAEIISKTVEPVEINPVEKTEEPPAAQPVEEPKTAAPALTIEDIRRVVEEVVEAKLAKAAPEPPVQEPVAKAEESAPVEPPDPLKILTSADMEAAMAKALAVVAEKRRYKTLGVLPN